jgi:hypothetical protein
MHPSARAITLPGHRLSRPAASALLLGFGLSIGQAQAREGFVVDLEWGAAWQGRNVVQSPNDDSGTRFALDRLTGDGPVSAPRVQVGWAIAPRHELRFVVAPLRLSGSGGLEGPVRFEGGAFAAGPAEARYRFDSYRATWRYTVHVSGSTVVKAGATGKLRDAEITLRQGGVTSTRSDTGFVPLLHLYAETGLGERTRLVFEGDGLAGGPGRAFDLSLRLVRDLGPGLSLFGGLRMLDGGVDSSSIYNFARFEYLTAGAQWRW